MPDGKVNLLWTGGWDSTFRLLQLCHDTEATIQPHYLVDEERASTPREMQVMEEIRRDIRKCVPGSKKRLLPTQYGDYRGITMESDILKKWEALKQKGSVGLQYPVLASYARQENIDRLELCVLGSEFLGTVLSPIVKKAETPSGMVPVLQEGERGAASLFDCFSFPLLGMTKRGIKKEATCRGWMSVMRKTWFCFNPTLGYPCGFCTPCRIAQEENMGHRIGYLGRLISPFMYPRKRVVAWLEHMEMKEEIKRTLRRVGLRS